MFHKQNYLHTTTVGSEMMLYSKGTNAKEVRIIAAKGKSCTTMSVKDGTRQEKL
jgi:hypothetical protein